MHRWTQDSIRYCWTVEHRQSANRIITNWEQRCTKKLQYKLSICKLFQWNSFQWWNFTTQKMFKLPQKMWLRLILRPWLVKGKIWCETRSEFRQKHQNFFRKCELFMTKKEGWLELVTHATFNASLTRGVAPKKTSTIWPHFSIALKYFQECTFANNISA